MTEPEWNISNDQHDSVLLGLNNMVDMTKAEIDSLKQMNESLKKEIYSLREEAKKSTYIDHPPEYYNGLWETDEK